MTVAIIDAEIVGKTKHRFPNLACMKLSAWYKKNGNDVTLKTDYKDIDKYDEVFISKVFTDTEIPDEPKDKSNKKSETIIEWYKDNSFLKKKNVKYGGTGFFFKEAPSLPSEIEHIKPDYHLYDDWVGTCISNGAKDKEFTYYKNYSIGFLTRGCFRGCSFCVNEYKKFSVKHSSVLEFMDEDRSKLCFLDDNFFACRDWQQIICEAKEMGKKFQFKQGLDERLLSDDKIHELLKWNYDGSFIFAFDNIEDRKLIETKLKRIFELYPNFKKGLKFYVLCGFDKNGKWDKQFWLKDIADTFERCFILAKYSALPYIMRYEKCYKSEFSGLYSTIGAWVNQPNIFKKFDFATYAKCAGMSRSDYKIYKRDFESYIRDVGKKGSTWRYYENMVENYKDIADKYFYITPDSLLEYGSGKKFL